MSFFASKKEKDDEDAVDEDISSSSAEQMSSASWFGVDMSGMQSALQAGIADFQDAINEQVEEVSVGSNHHLQFSSFLT